MGVIKGRQRATVPPLAQRELNAVLADHRYPRPAHPGWLPGARFLCVLLGQRCFPHAESF